MKKILSLVLVIALAFSLVTFASAATATYTSSLSKYSDKDAITYDQAVELLTSLSVLEGTNGAFNPAVNVTREQAAKIMCYITLGSTVAASLPSTKSSFSDVAVTRWSAPYIEYCVQAGIINGYGDGKFGPEDNVTAVQFAKMLLVALGYGAKGEFTGANWAINTIILGQSQYILTTGVDYNAPATREQIAFYAFNALNTNVVTYSSVLDTYTATGVLGTGSAQTLGNKIFGLTFTTPTVAGATGRIYYKNGVQVCSFYPTDSVLGTINANKAIYKATLYNDYTWDTWVNVYTNGYSALDAGDADGDLNLTEVLPVASSTFAAQGIYTAVFNAGQTVTLLDTDYDKSVDKIQVNYSYLAQVTAVSTTLGYSTIKVYDQADGSTTNNVTLYNTSFAKYDYLYITPNAASGSPYAYPLAVGKATTATGTVASQNTTTGTVTIAGTAYILGDATVNMFHGPDAGALNYTSTFTAYLDANKNVIGYTTADLSAGLKYLYVTDSLSTEANPLVGLANSCKATVMYMDGTSAVISLPIAVNPVGGAYAFVTYSDTGVPAYTDLADGTAQIADGFFSYTTNADGTINLSTLNAAAAVVPGADVATTYNTAAITWGATTKYASSTTAITNVYVGSASTVTGLTALGPDYTVATTPVLVTMNSISGVVTNIYVVHPTSALTTTTYGVVTAVGETTSAGTSYSVTVNGTATTIVDADTFAVYDIVTVVTTAGVMNATAAVPTATAQTVTYADSSYIMCGGAPLVFASNVVIFDGYTGETTTVTVGSTVSYFVSGGVVTAVFVY